MSKLHIVTAAAGLLGVCACAQQPTARGPLPLPMTQTASTDWTVAVQPDGTLGQSDDDGDGATLEDRARAVLGNKPMRGTLPDNELNQESAVQVPPFRDRSATRRTSSLLRRATWIWPEETRDPRLAKRATEIAAYGRLQAQALEAARLWLDLDKNNPQARQTLAALLVSSNKLSEAKPLLEALITADGNVATGFMQLNSMLAKHPDRNAVLAIVKELAKGYPQLPEAHFAVAQAAFSAGKYDVASAQIKEALEAQAGLGDRVRCSTPKCCSSANPMPKRSSICSSSCAAYPKAREVRANYARLLINNKQLKEARAEYQVLLEDQPANADIVVTIGLLSLQMNEFATAETWLKRGLELKYRDPDPCGSISVRSAKRASASMRR